MLRRILVPIVGAIALLLLAGPASAAPKVPNATPVNLGTFLPDTPGELCPFPVMLVARNGQVVRTTLPDETTILTGPFVLTITNETNGRSATFNISGPTFTSGNQLTITGTAIVLLFSEFAPPGPGILATNGRGTIDENLDFNTETFKGRTRDVCQLLG
jgi:hypothetical protein